MASARSQNFVGLANYTRALSDRVFIGALGHNLQLVVLSLVIQLPLALGLALLIRGTCGAAPSSARSSFCRLCSPRS